MAISDDFQVAANGNITYVGTTANYTVIALHRWLGDLMDDAQASGNDILDITDATASERSTDNIITLKSPYNIDDTAAQHLYDGSVIQAGGDTIYDGILVFAAAGMRLEVIQNGALVSPNFWTTGLNADAAAGISHRFMLKVRSAGADTDGRRLIGQTREFSYTYSEFKIGGGTARGNNVMALTYADDLNNDTAEATVAGWTGITNLEGYQAIDADGNGTNEYYYSKWDKDIYSINQFYERMKWLTRRGSASTVYELNGELFRGITHEIDTDTPLGGFNAIASVTWTGGAGQMVAINNPSNPTKMWIQLKTGVIPTDNQLISSAVANCQVNVGITERSLSFPYCGASTGSAIIGAYGFGIEAADLSASDKVTDLTNTPRTPPNNVTFTVGGIVNGEDRVLVGPAQAGALDEDQLFLLTTLSGAGETAVVCNAGIPSDTPKPTGTVRIQLNSGIYRRVPYTTFSVNTFTIASTNFVADPATAPKNVYISYIDKLADANTAPVTWVFSSNRDLFIRVRDGGSTPIKTFETTGVMGSAGGSATAIRTADV